MYVVLRSVLVLVIFCSLAVFYLELKTKFIKFWTKFWMKSVKLLSSKYNSLLLCQSSEIGCVCSEVTSTNPFNATLFALGSEKNKKITKGMSFKTAWGWLAAVLTLRHWKRNICGFVVFQFKAFISHFKLLSELKTTFIKQWTKVWIE